MAWYVARTAPNSGNELISGSRSNVRNSELTAFRSSITLSVDPSCAPVGS